MVMTGHFAIPALGHTPEVPATLSRSVIHNFLRGELGFEGIIITDAFDMGAITQGAGQLVDAIAALRADVDLLPLTANREVQERLEAGLKLAYNRGLIEDHHLIDSTRRITALRQWVGTQIRPGLEVVGCPKHRALAQTLAEKSITLVRDDANLLPLRHPSDTRILAIMPLPKNLTPADTSETVPHTLAEALRSYHPRVDEIIVAHSPDAAEIAAVRERAAQSDLLVLGTLSASMNPAQAALADALLGAGVPAVTVALRTPYDLSVYPRAAVHLCTYSMLPDSTAALAEVLFGGRMPAGVLPVAAASLAP
jgi:beta-N-acetylhexosaminidase